MLGYSVTLWNRAITDQRQKKLAVKIKMLERALGRSGQGLITHTQALDALPPVITIEALLEDLSIKRDILSQLGAITIFSATVGIDDDISNYLLGRMSLGEADKNGNNIWYRIGKTMLKAKLRNTD